MQDHCSALWRVFRDGVAGQVYNVGGNNERTNLEVVRTVLRRLDKPESLIQFVTDRPGHDKRYAIDASRIKTDLGWEPTVCFEEGIALTVDWYLAHQTWLDQVASGEYRKYYQEMYGSR